MSRLEQLKEMLAHDPADAFLNYALALELDKLEEHDASLKIYARLIKFEPPYVPAFFMAGQMLSRIDRNDEARQYLQAGIVEARRQGNMHAAGEMTEFLEMIDD